LDNNFLAYSDVEFLITIQERPPKDPIMAVLDFGVDEDRLYAVAAAAMGVELLDVVDWELDDKASLSLSHQMYFRTVALRRTLQSHAQTVYASDNFTRIERLRGALTTLTGSEQKIALLRFSQFEELRRQQEARASFSDSGIR
jgi:hypothetical protein